jgi:drug/metabolite transporter (DMT)-like permease
MTLSSPARPAVPPALVLALGILSVSTASIFITFAQTEAHSLVIAAARLTIASLILAPITLRRHRADLKRLTRRDRALAAASGILLAIHFATWITSLAYTSITSSIVLVQTAPLWVAILAPIFLRESIKPRAIWGLVLALSGGAAVSLSDACIPSGGRLVCQGLAQLIRGDAFTGNFLAVCGAWSAAGYLIIGRGLRARLPLLPYIFIVYGMAALVLLAALFSLGHTPRGYAPATYLWFVLLALIPQLLGHSSFNWALGYMPASFVSIAFIGEPLGTIILAYFILGETPGVVKLIGAGVILLGIYLASKPAKET